jgi:hypothetical protein
MLRIARNGLTKTGAEADVAAARQHFDERHWLRLRGFVDSDLLRALHRELDRAEFYDRSHDGIGAELCLASGPITASLELLANDPALFSTIDELTGCGPFGCFDGRVYRMMALDHHDSWHSDLGEDRRVAMSVNLSTSVYSGGVTEFRHSNESDAFDRVANTGFGDAIIFRLDPGLRHRVTGVEGSMPKTAWAGWFRATPNFRDLFRARAPS